MKKSVIKKRGVWHPTDAMSATETKEFALRIEELGYSMLWVPETTGRDPFAHIAYLASETKHLNFATGIANIYEVCTHLRGEAGARQVEGAKIGMTHVIGLGTACGIHILETTN